MSDNWPFIIAAYAVAVLVIAMLTAWVTLDHRALTRRLAELDAQGAPRARRSI
ncbi:MAG: heme exporter protein CcmD [Beijerinckiaceae bacterium]